MQPKINRSQKIPVPRISSPHKICKEAKVAEKPIGATAPMDKTNPALGETPAPDPGYRSGASCPKNTPINLKFQTNYKPIVKRNIEKIPYFQHKTWENFLKNISTSPDSM
ncbi:hypothetical protein TNIN_198651 [Trichonephila inaurata madagascariensis]|uniref:Uncharacterized protein n=1 Tax=Trichonephila inaurata madagascariensis TaxID=2747483 RepID=A0A8X6YSP1_9ARAC|nr:hypothetical protein TNIN_198651 [Trichonephila inaurata madagascariensis]